MHDKTINKNGITTLGELIQAYEYERLTKRSGLELNADKTEILNLNSKEKD